MKIKIIPCLPLLLAVLGATALTGCPVLGTDGDLVGRWRVVFEGFGERFEHRMEFTSDGGFIETFSETNLSTGEGFSARYGGTYFVNAERDPKAFRADYTWFEEDGVRENIPSEEVFSYHFIYEFLQSGNKLRTAYNLEDEPPVSFADPDIAIQVWDRF